MPGESTHLIRRVPSIEFASVSLRVVRGPGAGASVALSPGTSRVGSSEGSTLRIADPTVSRLHCEVQVSPDGVFVSDCGSTNGTFVDGVEVERARLAAGSTLRLGAAEVLVELGGPPQKVLLSPRDRFGGVLGGSLAMRRVYAAMESVAPTNATVLLIGETGSGKEVVARAVHEASKRSAGPFVVVDCGAIAEHLVESELFGHQRGAFTGALGDRRGLFEEADGGTIFLDEIGEMPLALQPKLLRALETREIRRVGGNAPRRVDVRVIAATHRPLAQHINEGTFREDLYYRLAVVEIDLPPLRARREDIALLAQHFHESVTGDPTPLPAGVIRGLVSRAWPGNVRELRNVVERSAALGWASSRAATPAEPPDATAAEPALPGAVTAQAAPVPVPVVEGLVPLHLPLKQAREVYNDQFEALYVAALLRKTGGNVTRAAEIAGVNRRYLHRLIAAHGIRGADREPPGSSG